MPKYIIERNVPGVGASSADQLQAMSKKSLEVLSDMKGEVKWLETFVTGDKIYCVYVAPNEDLVRQHAKMAGFPADRVSKVEAILDPSSGEEIQAMAKMSNKDQTTQKPLQ
jgi:hypothetical protein